MKGALRLSRAFARLHEATLSLSVAMRNLADRINENTNRAKWRAIYEGYSRMARKKKYRKSYYDPGSNPQPANPLKGLDAKRRGLRSKFKQPGNNDRIREAQERRAGKLARRAARARGDA